MPREEISPLVKRQWTVLPLARGWDLEKRPYEVSLVAPQFHARSRGLSPDTAHHTFSLAAPGRPPRSDAGHSARTSPLSCHLPHGFLRPLREETSVTLRPEESGAGSVSAHPGWHPASRGRLPRVRCTPQPSPDTCVPRAGRTSRLRDQGPSKPSNVAQGPSPSLGGGSPHVSPLMWCDGIFQASFQKEKVNNVKALWPAPPPSETCPLVVQRRG